MPEPLPVAWTDFPPDEFPVVIEALHAVTRAVVWRAVLERPAGLAALHIPPLARQLGHPVTMRITVATGQVVELDPPVTRGAR